MPEPSMPLLPRWRYMTPEARITTRRIGVSSVLMLFGLLLVRPLLPMITIIVIGWWIWIAIKGR
ncbi:MAG: hypothetical protein CL862_00160 [Cyanobium sp. NAT70]|nr:hypothetical protein [Cyanobium sp. NAT70]